MLGFLSLGLIWFLWINLVFWFNLGFITLEGVVFPSMQFLLSRSSPLRCSAVRIRVAIHPRSGVMIVACTLSGVKP